MSEKNAAGLLCLLSRLSPLAFDHPVWVHFSHAHSGGAPLAQVEPELEIREEWLDAGQVLLLAAALHSRMGDQAVALHLVRQAQCLAEHHHLPQLDCWAEWAASAVCLREHDYREAAESLRRLQAKLNAQQDWLLADVVALMEEDLRAEMPAAPGGGQGWPLIRPEAYATHLLSWLEHWGDPPSTLATGCDRQDPVSAGGSAPVRDGNSPAWSNRSRLPSSDGYLMSAPLPRLPSPGHAPVADKLSGSGRPASRSQSQPTLAVCCLGAFRATYGDQLIAVWPSRKSMAVFKYLVLAYPNPVPKEVLMDCFWPEADPESARRSLHQAIYNLRQALKHADRLLPLIQFANDSYSFQPGLDLWADIHEFDAHVQAGQRLEAAGSLEEALAEYSIAEGLYQGDLLEEDPYEEWLQWPRDQKRQAYLDTADRLAEYYARHSEWPAVIALCLKILGRDHCHESAHRRLMRCYLAQGQRHLAVRQYQVCAEALSTELNLTPSPETVDLYRTIVSR